MVQKYKTKVIEIREDTHNTRVFKVVFDGIENFNFIAGQFVMMWKEDFKNEQGYEIKRAYSIASSPDQKGYLEFCIKKERVFSSMIMNMEVGTELWIEGPHGKFILDNKHRDKDIVFFAGGSGISSVMSLMRALKYEKSKQNIYLFYGFREAKDFIFKNELITYPNKFENFNFVPCVTSGQDPGLPFESKRVNLELIKKYLVSPENKKVFIVGSGPYVVDVRKMCKEFGFKSEDIHVEVY
ncbi:MAG: FAD-dependent oxidoreductase [Candidatus Nanoarchaeia archaeon]|nr:FAD-dependent oxidoreductase [Candidatus Nanoarchaeia archaeon]